MQELSREEKELHTRDIQLLQLQMLKDITKVLDEEKIVWFAIGGTALGAYRHKGFIPWDDDIDIAIPRDDYERFLTLQEKLPSNFFIQHHTTEKEYSLYITKVRLKDTLFVEHKRQNYNINHGIFVDFFPWDNLPEDTATHRKVIKSKLRRFRRSIKKQNQNLLYPLKKFIYDLRNGFKSTSELFLILDKEYKKYNNQKLDKIGNVFYKDILKVNQVYPLKKIAFEDMEVYVPNKIEEYLEGKYGADYMERTTWSSPR